MKLLAKFVSQGSYPVRWEFDGANHAITYGERIHVYTNDLTAAHEYGECVRHSLECAGKLERF